MQRGLLHGCLGVRPLACALILADSRVPHTNPVLGAINLDSEGNSYLWLGGQLTTQPAMALSGCRNDSTTGFALESNQGCGVSSLNYGRSCRMKFGCLLEIFFLVFSKLAYMSSMDPVEMDLEDFMTLKMAA